MKHIKKYITCPPSLQKKENFNIGDYVICTYNKNYEDTLKLNKIYVVQDAKIDGITNVPQIKVNRYYNNSVRFRSATPEEIEELKIKDMSNKYNL